MPSLTEKLKFLNKFLGECQISRDSENASFVCPSCCDSRFSKKKKLVVKLDSDVFHCWVCGIKGKNLYNLLKKYFGKKCAEEYGEKFHNSKLLTGDKEEDDLLVKLPRDFKLISDIGENCQPDEKAIKNYAKSRGVSSEKLWYFKLGVSNEWNFRRRIIFPSFDADGYLNYFVARTIDENINPKYLNAKSDKIEIIFNEINIDWQSELTVVEGPFDLVNCNNNSTCLLGSFLSKNSRLLKMIVKNKTPTLLSLDRDASSKSQEIARMLSEYDIEVRLLPLGDKNDVGEMTNKEFIEAKKSAEKWNRNHIILDKIKSISTTCLL